MYTIVAILIVPPSVFTRQNTELRVGATVRNCRSPAFDSSDYCRPLNTSADYSGKLFKTFSDPTRPRIPLPHPLSRCFVRIGQCMHHTVSCTYYYIIVSNDNQIRNRGRQKHGRCQKPSREFVGARSVVLRPLNTRDVVLINNLMTKRI